ncbi:large ribosomal subunit protein mL44-like [Liolophura sinensis]|uniref:large ribosomal subunit protein mL44-like n=1 Tax=Liolophura sinensis TaxID=3198878 RepID=UPI0031582375
MASLGRRLCCHVIRRAMNLTRVSDSAVLACVQRRDFKKWERPYRSQMYKRRLEVGPEPERPRSAWINWNYDAEIFAFGKRLGEDFDEDILRQAFTHRSYIDKEGRKRAELGFGADLASLELQDNEELTSRGEEVAHRYIQAFLRTSYPYLPEEGIRGICEFLMTEEMLAFIGSNLGLKDLILSEDFPPLESTISKTFFAVIGALCESQSEERAHTFVRDFILPQLIGKDVNEMWEITNPMGLLTDILTAQGHPAPEARLLRESASTTVMSLYWVGIYCNKELIGESPGETVSIAEEMAARESLKNIFRTADYREPLKFGRRGENFEVDFDKVNLSLEEYVKPQQSVRDS